MGTRRSDVPTSPIALLASLATDHLGSRNFAHESVH